MQSKTMKDFIGIVDDNYEVYFSIGEKSYSKSTENGKANIKSLEDIFSMDSIKYISQVHSDRIINLINIKEDTSKLEADAIITGLKNTGIGVFYADCVPVILYDKSTGIIAAVHSGWRGTYEEIVKKTVLSMESEYSCKASDIKVIIGPHIHDCCYEVSEELKTQFIEKDSFRGVNLFKGRNLSLKKAIIKGLNDLGVEDENILTLDYCTCCEKDIKLHSYRRDGINSGRCYGFIVKK
ncbi:peptidoglycan editing factor PgeF [Clostridium sp. 'White wine YQ']|uniref:peptidoglycan editing factor PgeF n=1 Tax=Clostridium sp. 'White wine YQ' TaxID=3027474 RepID=UPI0023654481|nr:peptidoglycan editing factor PgeF [Clostridium sp. 'White wine YQ']MDD7793642.1 peptidoglycan editing factor PgeF [Clostridium sp. 'White wine YQ']